MNVDDLDKLVEKLADNISGNYRLLEEAKHASGIGRKWMTLGKYVHDHLGNISEEDFCRTGSWHRLAHKLQQETELDLGFCEHFVPHYRKIAKEVLEGRTTMDSMPKCSYGESVNPSTCNGLNHENCVVKHPEIKRQQEMLQAAIKLSPPNKAKYN